MFLTTCKVAMQLVPLEWQEKTRKQWKWELEHWNEQMGNPEEVISRKLASRIEYLTTASKEFEELLLQDTDKYQRLAVNELAMDIAHAYLYVDEASDWICAQRIKEMDKK